MPSIVRVLHNANSQKGQNKRTDRDRCTPDRSHTRRFSYILRQLFLRKTPQVPKYTTHHAPPGQALRRSDMASQCSSPVCAGQDGPKVPHRKDYCGRCGSSGIAVMCRAAVQRRTVGKETVGPGSPVRSSRGRRRLSENHEQAQPHLLGWQIRSQRLIDR